jgi:glutamate 5-kinase
MYKRAIIKIGSNVLSKNGALDTDILAQLVSQTVSLRQSGIEVVLVTSGAVATGKGILKLPDSADSIVSKQVFASIGQVKLMAEYAELFEKQGYVCAQVLVTKEDFRDRQHYLNMKNCLENLLQDKVVPIINENDVISVTELVFTDNDELAGLVASALGADLVVLLTSVDGLMENSGTSMARVISVVDSEKETEITGFITDEKSAFGRGGMYTKVGIAKKLAAQGITTFIANGRTRDVLSRITKDETIGTKFLPHRKVSAPKRRIAYSEGLSKGAVYVNKCAVDVLLGDTAASLLPIGIVKIEGEFEKGDIIEIRDEAKKKLGFGIAQYGNEKAQESIGKKNIRALIHYDYMFIE